MGYALIWIESLASALVLIALLTARSAHWSRPLRQRVVPIGVALLLATLMGCLTWAIAFLQFGRGVQISWFSWVLLWTLGFIVGTAVLLWRGFKQGADAAAGARAWPSAKLALTLGVLALLTWTTFSNMDLAVKIQMAAVRAEAGAKILAAAPPRLLDRDNAALIYQEAFANLTPVDKLPERWKPILHDFDEDQKRWKRKDILFGTLAYQFDPKDRELPELLAGHERALALFRQAASMPGCWFEHDYFQGGGMLLPEVDNLCQGIYLLGLDAQQRAARGDSRGALEDVAAMLGIARHVNEPILISFMVSAATEKAAAKVLERVLARTRPGPDDLARLVLDDKTSYRRLVHRACQMEEAGIGLSLYALVSAPSASSWMFDAVAEENSVHRPGMAMLHSPFFRVFFLQDDVAGYRRAMKQIQYLAGLPYHEAARGWQEFDESFKNHPPGIIAMLIVPAADRSAITAADADTARQLSRLALAMTSYRLKNKDFPAKLDDLVPGYIASVPRDPFDGQPLRMKRDGKDAVLYSVGRNGQDDGGIPGDPFKKEGDIVFRLRGE